MFPIQRLLLFRLLQNTTQKKTYPKTENLLCNSLLSKPSSLTLIYFGRKAIFPTLSLIYFEGNTFFLTHTPPPVLHQTYLRFVSTVVKDHKFFPRDGLVQVSQNGLFFRLRVELFFEIATVLLV